MRQKKPHPHLSIVILNYNRKEDSLDLIASLFDQTYTDYEIIFVDNASADGSGPSISKVYPKARFVPLKKNIGRAGHNIGAKIAKGNILLFLDADIILPRNFLKKLAIKFESTIDATSFCMKHHDGVGYPWEPVYSVKGNKSIGYDSTFGGGMWAIRRYIFEEVGGFNPRFFVYVDEWEYLIRLWEKGYSVRYFPDLIGYHKESPYTYRSIMKGYHVIVNHAQIYALYLPVRLWFRFLKHHVIQTGTILKTGEAERMGVLKGLMFAFFFFLRSLPNRKPITGEVLTKFLSFYFPRRGEVVVGKWGWGNISTDKIKLWHGRKK